MTLYPPQSLSETSGRNNYMLSGSSNLKRCRYGIGIWDRIMTIVCKRWEKSRKTSVKTLSYSEHKFQTRNEYLLIEFSRITVWAELLCILDSENSLIRRNSTKTHKNKTKNMRESLELEIICRNNAQKFITKINTVLYTKWQDTGDRKVS
jgi:hypothetical protein